MSSLQNFLSEKINKRKQEGLFRELKKDLPPVDFCSNDYLGLARSEELLTQISDRIKNLNLRTNGATGSRLLSGNSRYVQEVEKKLASIFKSEATLILNSGYAANLAVLSSIPQKGDAILYDDLAHASIKDGARLSLATRHSFRHNDLTDLENKIQRANGRVYVVVESIYSMDGDACPLKEVVALTQSYDASIILDEAHSTGAFGESGNGLACQLGLQDKIDIRVYTFGKAMGVHGACVAGTNQLANYIINFARPFIYTTALPAHSIASIDCAFDYLKSGIGLQNTLQERISLFLSEASSLPNRTQSNSAIQTAIFPGNENVRNAALTLQQQGFDVRPILSPTVPKDSERLRVCLHTYNTENEIAALAKALRNLATIA